MSQAKQAIRAGLSAIALSLGIIGVTAPVHADEAAPAAPDAEGAASGGLEEVMVTARRREEKLQTVPVSVAAFNVTTLTEKGVEATTDLQIAGPRRDFQRRARLPEGAPETEQKGGKDGI
jgi:iron complex outermembrane recepter protein